MKRFILSRIDTTYMYFKVMCAVEYQLLYSVKQKKINKICKNLRSKFQSTPIVFAHHTVKGLQKYLEIVMYRNEANS